MADVLQGPNKYNGVGDISGVVSADIHLHQQMQQAKIKAREEARSLFPAIAERLFASRYVFDRDGRWVIALSDYDHVELRRVRKRPDFGCYEGYYELTTVSRLVKAALSLTRIMEYMREDKEEQYPQEWIA